MFRYIFALLLAPLLRPVFNAVLLLLAVAFAVTVPARLWVMYVDPRPSYHMISALNVATFASLVVVVAAWRFGRRHSMRRSYSRRQRGTLG